MRALLVQRIRELAAVAPPPAIVAIDGCGGAGKSALADALAAELAGVTIVHTDDMRSRWTDIWMPEEEAYVRAQRPHLRADFVVDGERLS